MIVLIRPLHQNLTDFIQYISLKYSHASLMFRLITMCEHLSTFWMKFPSTADDAICLALLLTASIMPSWTYWSVKKYCLYYIFSMAWNTEFYPLNKSDISIGCYFDIMKISKCYHFHSVKLIMYNPLKHFLEMRAKCNYNVIVEKYIFI